MAWMPKEKICTRCKQSKPLTEFGKNNRGKGGLHQRCKVCNVEVQRCWKQKKKQQNPDEYYRKQKTKLLKKTHNMTLEEFFTLKTKQNNCCAICGKEEVVKNQWGQQELCVDHNHKTNKNRGLLCSKCNCMLGNAEENVDTLLNAIKYLRYYR